MDTLLNRLAPHDCLGCGAEGGLLCAACAEKLRPAAPCCYHCQGVSPRGLTCQGCRSASCLRQVQAVAVYEGLAKTLVWKLKFAHAQSAVREMATLMAPLVAEAAPGCCLIVPVPTATTRVRQRGYDQAGLLARELARCLRQPCVTALARQNQAHQVGASREQRRRQLAAAFRVTRPRLVKGSCIVLIDDVVTTGATLQAAAGVLQAAGATCIKAVTFAQTPLKARGF